MCLEYYNLGIGEKVIFKRSFILRSFGAFRADVGKVPVPAFALMVRVAITK